MHKYKIGDFPEREFNDCKKIQVTKISTIDQLHDFKHPALFRECFFNALYSVTQNSDIHYIEGFVVDNEKKMRHAWNKIGNAHFDPTYENPLYGNMGNAKYFACTNLSSRQILGLDKHIKEMIDFYREVYPERIKGTLLEK